jgi:3-oxoadipate enol-lactonase
LNRINDMPRLQANGATFEVAFDGPADAPCLVLSHSLGSSLEMWSPQAGSFSRHFRVLRYDARGHGRTDVTPGPYTIERLARDVIGLLDAAGIDKASFCGSSMGGATGLWLAAHAPERFERFVFCNTAPWLGPPAAMLERAAAVRREGLEGFADATMQRWFTEEFRARQPQTVASIRATFVATPREGYAACCEALAGYDVRAHLASIDRPVLVVAGLHDPSPPIATARDYAARIAGARLVEVPSAHLSNLGAQREFDEAVLGFLSV